MQDTTHNVMIMLMNIHEIAVTVMNTHRLRIVGGVYTTP